MNGNLLLYWMSHLGEGSWSRFADALKELDPDADHERLRKKLPISLSDFALVDFSRATRKWKVRKPVLAGLAAKRCTALLCGGRSEELIQCFQDAAHIAGCAVSEETNEHSPSRFIVQGSPERLSAIERTTGIQFIADFSLHLLASAVPVMKKYETGKPEKGILNWAVRVFDIEAMRWIPLCERLSIEDRLPSKAAIEFKSDYEVKYCVTDSQAVPRRLPRRECVYAAGSLKRHCLVHYDMQQRLLSTPLEAPLPELYTRVCCLCSGEPALIQAGKLIYREVPPALAATLITLAGQQHPAFKQL